MTLKSKKGMVTRVALCLATDTLPNGEGKSTTTGKASVQCGFLQYTF